MDTTIRTQRRTALLVAAAFALILAVTPATALAKVQTAIVVPALVDVDNSVRGVEPTTPVITAKLYRKSGSRYVALYGHLHCYFVDPRTGAKTLIGQANGSRVAFALGSGAGDYQVSYAGSKVYHSAQGFTNRADTIGAIVSEPTVTITSVDATYSLATLSWDVTWNADAYDGSATFTYIGYFASDVAVGSAVGTGTAMIWLTRWVTEPETVLVSYRFKTADAVGNFRTMAVVELPGGSNLFAGDRGTVFYTYAR
jgi:hypothetical protein